MATVRCAEHEASGASLSIMWCPACVQLSNEDRWTDPYAPAQVSIPTDANGSIVLGADSYVGPCPGTFGLSSCPEEIRADDVGKDGKQRCWRCGWMAA